MSSSPTASIAPMSETERAELWKRFPDPVKKFASQYMNAVRLCAKKELLLRYAQLDVNVEAFRKTGLEAVFEARVPNQPVRSVRLGIKLGNGKLKLLITLACGEELVTQEDVIQTLNDRDFPKEAKRWADQLAPFLWTGQFH